MSTNRDLDLVANWLGIDWSEQQRASLHRFEEWLIEEALPAGGVGPGERARMFDRHIADSLAFVFLINPKAATGIDVGTGVGLPAIPIAIARPDMEIVAIDRSERRTSLASRAVRILRLPNITVRTDGAASISDRYDVVTFRASIPLPAAAAVFKYLATDTGEGVFALSRKADPDVTVEPPENVTFARETVGTGVLDSPAWFLKMRHDQTKYNRST